VAKLPSFDALDYLLRKRLGLNADDHRYQVYRRWKRGEHPGPAERTFFAELTDCHEQLSKLPSSEIEQRVKQARDAEADAKEKHHPLNQLPAVADRSTYEYWSKSAYWSLEEAAALMLGRNPQYVNVKALWNVNNAPRLKRAYDELLELLKRARTARQIDYGEGPGTYLVWADRFQIDYPPELKEQVELHGHPLRDWKHLAEEREKQVAALEASADERAAKLRSSDTVAARERVSMLKLIIGMAVRGYGFNPKTARNRATTEIVGDLEELGIALDDATVLKYLREGAAYLPDDAGG
jgi:hypothetical protein